MSSHQRDDSISTNNSAGSRSSKQSTSSANTSQLPDGAAVHNGESPESHDGGANCPLTNESSVDTADGNDRGASESAAEGEDGWSSLPYPPSPQQATPAGAAEAARPSRSSPSRDFRRIHSSRPIFNPSSSSCKPSEPSKEQQKPKPSQLKSFQLQHRSPSRRGPA